MHIRHTCLFTLLLYNSNALLSVSSCHPKFLCLASQNWTEIFLKYEHIKLEFPGIYLELTMTELIHSPVSVRASLNEN